MKAFEYVVVYRSPSDANNAKLLTPAPVLVLAKDAEAVKRRACRDVAIEETMSIDDIEVVVRPFA